MSWRRWFEFSASGGDPYPIQVVVGLQEHLQTLLYISWSWPRKIGCFQGWRWTECNPEVFFQQKLVWRFSSSGIGGKNVTNDNYIASCSNIGEPITNKFIEDNKFPKRENLGQNPVWFGVWFDFRGWNLWRILFQCGNELQLLSLIVFVSTFVPHTCPLQHLVSPFQKGFRRSYCKSLAHGVFRACFFVRVFYIFGLYILIVSSFIGWCWWSVLVVNPRKFTIIEQLMYWYSHRFLHTIFNHRWFFSLEQWTKVGRLNLMKTTGMSMVLNKWIVTPL